MKTIISGIYRFKNIITGVCYIGQSVNINKRKNQHLNELILNKHHCSYFQNAFNKYGKDNFVHEVLEVCFSNLTEREQFWIDFHKESGTYNHAKVAGSPLGIKRSDETKLKLRNIKLGGVASEETKQKMRNSQALVRNIKSEKAKAQFANPVLKELNITSRKKRIVSDETRAKISASSLSRWSNKEYKDKMSLIQKESHKDGAEKQSVLMKLKWADPEYRSMMVTAQNS